MNKNFDFFLVIYLFHSTDLDRGRNMEPSMNTDPESRMYQQVESSPVLKKKPPSK